MKIVDEFTGRIMEGRRWSEGLHQAVEAKEGVAIQEEHQTLATITLQNYFRLYEKLGGMTGTAKTEEKEFVEIYGLNVVEIPTNVPVVRHDKNDLIFKTVEAKFNAVVDDIKERNAKGQPVLVGTIAVETSEYLSELLKRQGVPHNVLNAKEHAREAEIIKDAGSLGAVTIATNMAGRGVDIKIDDQVRELGGLYVLGTERHEARRIDNQLRGRSGRQGDPGETRFYLSGQDDLVRLFAGDRIQNIMERFKLPDDQPMEAWILSRQIENAQKKVEEQNFVARKNVLKYDDVMNVQRQVIYEQRNRVLHGEDLAEDIREEWLPEVLSNVVSEYTMDEAQEEWDLEGLVAAMETVYGTGVTADELRGLDREAIVQEFLDDALDAYAEREREIDQVQEGLMRDLERFIVLQTVDIRWREHLENMDYMREGIHLRGMAQKDPLVEYRNEGHMMFDELNRAIREEVVSLLYHAEVTPDDSALQQQQGQQNGGGNGGMSYEHQSLAGADAILAAGGSSAVATAAVAGGGSVATPRSRRSRASSRTSAATIPASAVPARSTRSATARSAAPRPPRASARRRRDPARVARRGARARVRRARRRRGRPALHPHPERSGRGVRAQLARPLRGRLGRRLARGLLHSRRERRLVRRVRRGRAPRPRCARGRARLHARPGGARPRFLRARDRALDPLVLRRARARAARTAHRRHERGLGASRRARRLPARRRPAQRLLQGGPALGHRYLVAAERRLEA